MKRREFIAGLGVAAASLPSLPLAVRAQQPALPVIGLLSSVPFETLSDEFVAFRRGLAETGAIAVSHFETKSVRIGALTGYGVDGPDAFRLAGQYVGRILNGEKPSELPVQQSTRFKFAINLKTAKALGLTIPPNLLALADEVIE